MSIDIVIIVLYSVTFASVSLFLTRVTEKRIAPAAKDEWDFKYQGMSNHPFIKANYPHHEGIWGWGSAADQVAMVVRNIRRSMVEYHDILWDIGYAQSWEKVAGNLDKVYSTRPPIDVSSFLFFFIAID